MCMPLFLGSIASILMDTENIINNPECTDENTNLNNLNKVKCDFFAPFLVKVYTFANGSFLLRCPDRV